MGIASAVSGGLGLATSIYQAISGNKEMNDAKDALANYHRQELNNVADGLQVSTLGSDLQRQEQSRLASNQVSALQDSGTRGLIGGLGRVEAGNQRVMQQTGADLDAQQKNIDQLHATDAERIRAMRNDIENRDIAGLSSQVQAGKQDFYGGLGNGIQSVGMLGNAFGKGAGANPMAVSSVSGGVSGGTNPEFQSPTTNRYYNPTDNGFAYSPNPPSQNLQYPNWQNPFVYNNPYKIYKR